LYSRAIEIDPDNAMYYNNMSLAYFRKGEYQKALSLAEKSLELDPNLIKAHIKKV
jgi:tetratricopeptide (TPR) repeat protein